MTDRELMQQALDALEWNLPVIEDYGNKEQSKIQHKAITALRDRLAQPEKHIKAKALKLADEVLAKEYAPRLEIAKELRRLHLENEQLKSKEKTHDNKDA
jgi:hypothetical protein